MAENTKIQWATHTWNPWIGCAKVASGCLNCYAERDFAIRRKRVVWGPHGTRAVTNDAYWRKPLTWNRQAAEKGEHVRVFPSLCDPFEDYHDVGFWRERMFELIDKTPNIDWILLTKRPENIQDMWEETPDRNNIYRPNVWLIYSASDQQSLEFGLPQLLRYRPLVPMLGLSLEPLIGPIDLSVDGLWNSDCPHCADYPVDNETGVVECRSCDGTGKGDDTDIDWVIVGGESGPHARMCAVDWIRDVIRQCAAASVPCFVKQLGTKFIPSIHDGYGRWRSMPEDPKCGDPDEWPEDLRVREFP